MGECQTMLGESPVMIDAEDLEKGPPLEKHGQTEDKASSNLPNAYYNTVKLKLKHRPWLECLYQFMNPDTKGFAMAPFRRMNDFDIKVIHFTESEKPQVIRCHNSEEFELEISEDKERMGTLIIAKNLSRRMIETLGTTYKVEPEFFASYLAGTEYHRLGRLQSPLLWPIARSPHLLSDYIRKAPFYTVEYRRPYHIEGGKENIFKTRIKATNTPRGIMMIHPNLPDVFSAEKISVYKRKGSRVGIILTDQLLSSNLPASHIASPVSLLDGDSESPGADACYRQVSARRQLISWIERLTPDEAKALFDDRKQLALQPILKIVERCGVMFLLHARYLMNRVLTHHCDAMFPDDTSFFLYVSRSLHRYTHYQRRILLSSLELASLRGGDDIAEQKEDFTFLVGDLDQTLNSLQEDVKFLVGEASVREGKVVGWVSKFAAVFLPVSLLATILSISDPGFVRWAILGGLSVPFVLISIYLMFMFPAYFDGPSSSIL